MNKEQIRIHIILPNSNKTEIKIPTESSKTNILCELLKQGYKEYINPTQLNFIKEGKNLKDSEIKTLKSGETITLMKKVKGGARYGFMDPFIVEAAQKAYENKLICGKCNKCMPLNSKVCRSKKCGNGKTLRERKRLLKLLRR